MPSTAFHDNKCSDEISADRGELPPHCKLHHSPHFLEQFCVSSLNLKLVIFFSNPSNQGNRSRALYFLWLVSLLIQRGAEHP